MEENEEKKKGCCSKSEIVRFSLNCLSLKMSDIITKLKKDMFASIKSHDQVTSGIIQLSLASIKNTEIDKGEELTDEEIIQVLRKEVKKLDDSIEQFKSAGDSGKELAETTQVQKEYLSQYLPALMEEGDIEKAVETVISETGAESMRDMGKVMGAVMGKLSGKADGSLVKDIVTKKLQG